MRKIALEEHFMAPGFAEYEGEIAKMMTPADYGEFCRRLLDFSDMRIAVMDKAGIDICVLSQTSPGVQFERDAQLAVKRAREANDFLVGQIEKHPSRFLGFAHLPMQEPAAAVVELKRCVNELGFKGALINGHTNGVYLDDDRYLPFWEVVAELDVPVYLHPVPSPDCPAVLKGYPALAGPTIGWTFETSGHVMRLIVSGLFDRFPSLRLVVGHMGESLPFMLWRLDSRWAISRHTKELAKPLSQYIKENVLITTSGVCDVPPLMCSIEALGSDNVLFSTDYPFESALVAANFIDTAPISDDVRAKVCHRNAERLFKLSS